MKNKFKFFKFVSLLFFVVFCVVLFNFKPVVNASGASQGETWLISENPSLTPSKVILGFDVCFTSNNTEYVKLKGYDYGNGIYEFRYYEDSSSFIVVYRSKQANRWLDDAYRTIIFDEAPTGDLLTWLQANAVKVVETIPVESIEIGFSGGKLWVGQTYQINPTVLPENATAEVSYDSNNTEVATVSASGLVSAVATGTATITASAGGKSDTVVFTVVENTYSAGYNDGYIDGYNECYNERYWIGYRNAIFNIWEMGFDTIKNLTLEQIIEYAGGYEPLSPSGDIEGEDINFYTSNDYFTYNDWVLTQVYEHGIRTVPKSDNTYYNNTESFDYISGYGQAWGLGYDLGYSEGSGRPLTPEEEGIVYNWGYNAGYQAGQEDHSVGGLLKQAFGGVGQLLDYELLPNLTIGGIVIVPLLLGIVFFILKRG